jgi:hypothetical protein
MWLLLTRYAFRFATFSSCLLTLRQPHSNFPVTVHNSVTVFRVPQLILLRVCIQTGEFESLATTYSPQNQITNRLRVIPQDPISGSNQEKKDGLAAIPISEDSKPIDPFLRFCYFHRGSSSWQPDGRPICDRNCEEICARPSRKTHTRFLRLQPFFRQPVLRFVIARQAGLTIRPSFPSDIRQDLQYYHAIISAGLEEEDD